MNKQVLVYAVVAMLVLLFASPDDTLLTLPNYAAGYLTGLLTAPMWLIVFGALAWATRRVMERV